MLQTPHLESGDNHGAFLKELLRGFSEVRRLKPLEQCLPGVWQGQINVSGNCCKSVLSVVRHRAGVPGTLACTTVIVVASLLLLL